MGVYTFSIRGDKCYPYWYGNGWPPAAIARFAMSTLKNEDVVQMLILFYHLNQ